jgi:hypothetical protein
MSGKRRYQLPLPLNVPSVAQIEQELLKGVAQRGSTTLSKLSAETPLRDLNLVRNCQGLIKEASVRLKIPLRWNRKDVKSTTTISELAQIIYDCTKQA